MSTLNPPPQPRVAADYDADSTTDTVVPILHTANPRHGVATHYENTGSADKRHGIRGTMLGGLLSSWQGSIAPSTSAPRRESVSAKDNPDDNTDVLYAPLLLLRRQAQRHLIIAMKNRARSSSP